MTTDVTTTPTEPHEPLAGSWWTGRSGLVFPLILAGFATYLLVGELTMEVAPETDPPGPQFFPAAIITLLYVFALLQTVALLRRPEPPGELHGDLRTTEITVVAGQTTPRFYSDWPRLAWAVGGFAAFILLLQPIGWILAAGLLFWTMTKAFGAPHPLKTALVSLTFSSTLYLVFAGLLSVNLPVGSIFSGGN
jgi:putative tricarboxylic transport membrane protein